MNVRLARTIAWPLVVIYIILVGAGLTLQGLVHTSYTQTGLPVLIILVSLVGVWMVTGTLIISRHPQHPIGWLLCAGLFFSALDMFSAGYTAYDTYVFSNSLPGVDLTLVWLKLDSLGPFGLVAFTLIILLFPDGRLLTSGWRKVAWTTVGALFLFLPLQAVEPGPADPSFLPTRANPLGVSASLWVILKPLMWIMFSILVLSYGAALASLIIRLRNSSGDVRQQIKWLIFPVGLFGIFFLLFNIGQVVGASEVIQGAILALAQLAVAGIVIAIAFAIFKYRLYDIDIIINRTLVYGTLTAFVIGFYVLIVGVSGMVIQTNVNLAGLLITAIVVGAIYRPVRVLLQLTVDRLIPVTVGSQIDASIHDSSKIAAIKGEDDNRTVRMNSTRSEDNVLIQPSANWMRIARLAWYPTFAIALWIFIPEFFKSVPGGIDTSRYSAIYSTTTLISRGLPMLAGLVSLFLALLLFWHRYNDRMGLFTSFFLLVYGFVFSGALESLKPFFPEISKLTEFILPGSVAVLTLILFAIFPDGRFVPRWTRWVALAALLIIPLIVFWSLLYSQPPVDFSQPVVLITTVLIVVLMMAGWISIFYAQVYRYRRVSTPQQRQQTKWAVYGMSTSFGLQMILTIPWIYSYNLPSGSLLPPWQTVSTMLYSLWIAILPVTLTIAVMRYRLYEIDIIINRTLVYGALTAFVLSFYVFIVGISGLVIQTNVNLAGLLITAIVVGAVFRPVRSLLQITVNRLIPVDVGSQFDASIHDSSRNAANKVQSDDSTNQRYSTVSEDTVPIQPSANWTRMARLVWYPTFAIALGIFILSIPKFFSSELGGIAGPRYSDISSPLTLGLIRLGITIMLGSGVLSLYLALLLFRQRPSDRTGLLTSFFLLTYGVIMTGSLAALESYLPGISFLDDTILSGLVNALALFLFAIFPDGNFVPRWTRWIVLTTFLIIPLSWFFYSFFSEPPIDFSRINVMIATALILILYVLPWISILYAQVYRYRHISTQQQKQQTKWVVFGLGIYFSLQIIGTIPYIYLFSLPLDSPLPPWQPIADIVYALTIAIIPVTLTIAVMRYRLYDVDIIINRTLVYGALTAIVIAIYGLIVGLVGAILHAQGNLLITLLATGLVAVLFQPLREQLQRTVNRFIYGERDNPIEALSRLGKQMEVALPSDQVLPALVKTIAQTLKLPYVGIALKGQRNITFGQETENPVAFPFIFQGGTTGVLLASPRSPGESFSSAETNLLQNLARQAGAAVRNAQLTADLQRSRQTLVTAREEERHRLRRDLHDGIGPTMAGLTLKLDAARDLVSSNLESGNKEELEEAIQLLGELKKQTQETVQNIRHIVHTLRPPSLDVLGLVPALQAHFGQFATPRSLDIQMTTTPQGFPRLSAAVEVAAYRIVLEAVTNVINHAQAGLCDVDLTLENGNLKMEIRDDGIGLPKTRKHGIGLDSMRERAEELGGSLELSSSPQGTRVFAEIPIAPARNKS